MKHKTKSILCLATVLIGFLSGSATAQKINQAEQEKITDKSTTSLNVKKSETSEPAAIEILEKNIQALGGQDAFARIKSVEMQTELNILGRTIKAKQLNDIAGKRSFQRQESGGTITETGFDGKRVWQKAPYFRGYLEAASLQAKAIMRDELRLPGATLYNYKSSGKKFARLADEQINGKNYLVVKGEDQDQTGKEILVKYYFDPATYLIKQIVSGNHVTQTENFDDYRQFNGVTIAFAVTKINPQASLTSKITELKFNVPINSAVFEFEEKETTPSTTTDRLPNNEQKNEQKNEQGNELTKQINGELSESIRLETFERAWKVVNDTFYDRTFNGVNWQEIHDKYLPLAKTTARSDDFHQLLNSMVQELRLSHFNVTPPDKVVSLGSKASDLNNGAVGLSFQRIDDQLIVSQVKKDSSADLAGIRPGFALKQINGKTPEELYAEAKKNRVGFQMREELARARAVSRELTGKPNTKISLELVDENETLLKKELLRKPQAPGRQLEFESKRLLANVGYLKFNLFFGDLLTKFQAALQEMKTTKALIIDLRGNGGGAGDLAPAIANLLSAQPGSLGSLKFRYETQQFSYQGLGEQAYNGKIILLIDAGTGSTAEVFAGGLQANNRAVVVGSPSAGAVLPSLIELLPTGGTLQYVVSNFQTPNGILLEGKGVVPDLQVKSSRAALLAGRDVVLEKSLSLIEK